MNGERERMLVKVKNRAVEEIAAMLDELWPQITVDMDRAAMEASKDEKRCKFNIGATIKLQPRGMECGLSVKIGWSNRKAAESEIEIISNQVELFEGRK